MRHDSLDILIAFTHNIKKKNAEICLLYPCVPKSLWSSLTTGKGNLFDSLKTYALFIWEMKASGLASKQRLIQP